MPAYPDLRTVEKRRRIDGLRINNTILLSSITDSFREREIYESWCMHWRREIKRLGAFLAQWKSFERYERRRNAAVPRYTLLHSYSRESLDEDYYIPHDGNNARHLRRVQKQGGRASSYKISIYRIFPLQWGLMSVILPGRKKSRCLRFKEDPLPKGSHSQLSTPRKYLQRDTHLRFEEVSSSFVSCIVWREREGSSFLSSRLSMRKLTRNLL